jgi:hypothetical protein
VAAQTEWVAFEELAVDLTEARREGLAIEPVEERFGVEEVDLTRASGHEEEDASLGPGRKVTRPWCQRAGRRAGWSVARQQVDQAEQSEAASCDLEELAAAAREEWLRAGTTEAATSLEHLGPFQGT